MECLYQIVYSLTVLRKACMKKHGTKTNRVETLSRNEHTRLKRNSNKTIRRENKRITEGSVLELWREKSGE